jgi:ketosteroid isomerase-like protein
LTQSSLALVVDYYSAMARGDFDKMGSYLSDDVRYVDPSWPLNGKDQVLGIAKKFGAAVNRLDTVAAFGADDKAVIIHDVTFKGSTIPLRSVAVVTVTGGHIQEINLICNPIQHIEICKAIFL